MADRGPMFGRWKLNHCHEHGFSKEFDSDRRPAYCHKCWPTADEMLQEIRASAIRLANDAAGAVTARPRP